MDFKEPRTRSQNPETKLTKEIRRYMEVRGWLVVKLHGNKFQAGLPDIVAFHPQYGTRWIEIKQGENVLSGSQIAMFSKMTKHGVKIYLMRSVEDYERLFKPANWHWGCRTMFGGKDVKLPKGL